MTGEDEVVDAGILLGREGRSTMGSDRYPYMIPGANVDLSAPLGTGATTEPGSLGAPRQSPPWPGLSPACATPTGRVSHGIRLDEPHEVSLGGDTLP